MRAAILLLALTAALPARAADWSCTAHEQCRAGDGCSDIDPEGEAPLRLRIAEDGQTATFGDGSLSLQMTLISESALGRTFLAEQPGQGIGLFTLRGDGSVIASSHEMSGDEVFGLVTLATCTAEAG
ncbi:hypothetical protein [Neotabrizicola sp. VNH66]|uniref:hypothetical protein n=1 Tax=Neotabrizicola sp. VNH66 TaxID=3400918 RepID=UPI003C0E5A9B